jgi:hypothetical protein
MDLDSVVHGTFGKDQCDILSASRDRNLSCNEKGRCKRPYCD